MQQLDLYIYRARIVSVYDGDTVRLDIDLGLGVWLHNQSIRLYGINAPEIRGVERPKGIAVRDWLREKLPVGTAVFLKTHRDKAGKYGRWLGELQRPGDELPLNQQMLMLGLAKAYKG